MTIQKATGAFAALTVPGRMAWWLLAACFWASRSCAASAWTFAGAATPPTKMAGYQCLFVKWGMCRTQTSIFLTYVYHKAICNANWFGHQPGVSLSWWSIFWGELHGVWDILFLEALGKSITSVLKSKWIGIQHEQMQEAHDGLGGAGGLCLEWNAAGGCETLQVQNFWKSPGLCNLMASCSRW